MTRLDTVRGDAQKLLVGALIAAVPIYAAASVFIDAGRLLAGLAVLAIAAGLSVYAWRTAPQEATTRMMLGASLMAFPACLTYLMSGHAWQIDMHMVFFAALAAVTVLCDWRALLAAAGTAAVHHLVLNFALPSAVFPGGGDFARVVFHAVVVVGQTGLLIWLSQTITRSLTDADEALEAAQAARAKADQLAEADKLRQGETETSRMRIAQISNAFEASVRHVLKDVETAAGDMTELAVELGEDGAATRTSAEAASAQAEETSHLVEAVASAAQELAASIAEVTRTLSNADTVSERAAGEAGKASASMGQLQSAAREIEDIAALVTSIAEQTNLLALNATIEAARAGEAGKGFAVVASEVKALADQTSRATDSIRSKIDAMGRAATETSQALNQIAGTIGEVRAASSSARDSFSEQSSATDEIARLAADAAGSTARVDQEINAVTGVAERAEAASARFEAAAGGLSAAAKRLAGELACFRTDLDAA